MISTPRSNVYNVYKKGRMKAFFIITIGFPGLDKMLVSDILEQLRSEIQEFSHLGLIHTCADDVLVFILVKLP